MDGAFERIWEVTKELATFVAEKNPLVELFNLIKRLGKAIKGKDPNKSGGGTEVMDALLSQLRRESKILQELKNTYEEAMKELDRVEATIRA